jgi:hypothetical protein
MKNMKSDSDSNREKLYRAIGQISDTKIAEADEPTFVRRVPLWKIAAPLAAAACFAVVIAAAVLTGGNSPQDIVPQNTGDSDSAESADSAASSEPEGNYPEPVAYPPLTLNRAENHLQVSYAHFRGGGGHFLADVTAEQVAAAFPHIASSFDVTDATAQYDGDSELYGVSMNIDDVRVYAMFLGSDSLSYGEDVTPVETLVHGIPVIAGVHCRAFMGSEGEATFEAVFTLDNIDYRIIFDEVTDSLENNRRLNMLVNTIIYNNAVSGMKAALEVLAYTDEREVRNFVDETHRESLREARLDPVFGAFLPADETIPGGGALTHLVLRFTELAGNYMVAHWASESVFIEWRIEFADESQAPHLPPIVIDASELTLETLQGELAGGTFGTSLRVITGDVMLVITTNGVTPEQLFDMINSVI